MGPEVEAFEAEFAAKIGSRHAFAVANGTAALHLAYVALGIGPQDEVIQPAVNFVAAANMTIAVGAKPVFADITGIDTPVLDPDDVESRITGRTKAVVAMHYGGTLCNMGTIRDLCSRRGLLLIEDACHAVGAECRDPGPTTVNGKMAGAIGDVGCFSFFSNKNLATGEGGMLVTNREDVAEKVRLLRSHGMSSLTWDRHRGHASTYQVTLNGYNYRLDDLRAALGRVQLRKLSANNALRRELVALYRQELSGLPGWSIPFDGQPSLGAAHLMSLVAPNTEERSRLVEGLSTAGVQTSIHYPVITGFSAFAPYRGSGLECSEAFCDRVVSLPLYPTLKPERLQEICRIVRGVAHEAPVPA